MKKISIITGATGGLGKEYINLLLNEDNDEIWAVARNVEKLKELEELSPKIKTFSIDLSKIDKINQIEELLKISDCNVRYLINNASLAKMGKYDEFTNNELIDTINVNITASTLLSQSVIPYMSEGSKIVNICSMAAYQPVPYINLYASTKAYLKNYTLSLNEELKDTGIKAITVCPGWIDTEMLLKEYNGVKTSFPMMKSAYYVASSSFKAIKKGKTYIRPSLYSNSMYHSSRIFGEKLMIRAWMRGIKKYVK